jgi:hypothetical protein
LSVITYIAMAAIIKMIAIQVMFFLWFARDMFNPSVCLITPAAPS